MKNLCLYIVWFLALGVFTARPCLADKDILNRKYDAGTNIDIDHMFDERVKSGSHPYRVKIRNGRARPITWTLEFDTSGSNFQYKSTHQIKVEPGAEVIEELLVPAPTTKGTIHSNHRRVQLNVSAPGLPSESRGIGGSSDQNWPSIAISKRLALNNLSRLASLKKKKKKGQEYFASQYSEIPTNWQGMTCIDVLLIDETTWQQQTKQQKRSIMTWVRYGGRMIFFSEKANAGFESLDLETPDTLPGSRRGIFSLGSVEISKWDGTRLPDNMVDRVANSRQFDSSFGKDYGNSWGLISDFGTKDFNPFLVFILLIIFAALVGPVNLFRFAKAGQRHRLFITTPIISLVACLIIIFIILVQDGVGGSGQRIAFVDIQSGDDQRQMQIMQQQVSRTGVMFRSGFETEENPGLTPVAIPDSRWNPISNGRQRDSSYRFRNGEFQGDLFRSRSEQGFHIRAVRPTRSRIERKNAPTSAAPPELFSSLEFGLKDFHYIDANGEVWKTAPGITIESGEKIPLKKSDKAEFEKWLSQVDKNLAEADRQRIKWLMKGHRYFGIAADPASLMVGTHDAIRWKNDLAIVSGVPVQPR